MTRIPSGPTLRPSEADLQPGQRGRVSSPDIPGPPRPWHDAIRDLIYMLFLGLESARHAIKDLVEFEPENAERTITVLISELEAYRFLLNEFSHQDDGRERRLLLRRDQYTDLVRDLCNLVGAKLPASKKELEESMAKRKRNEAYIETLKHDFQIWMGAEKLLPDLCQRLQRAMTATGQSSKRVDRTPPLPPALAEQTR